nr:hypothetical protein CFP56_70712 [Quercus suber]
MFNTLDKEKSKTIAMEGNEPDQSNQPPHCAIWKPPPWPILKVNSNDAIFLEQNLVGVVLEMGGGLALFCIDTMFQEEDAFFEYAILKTRTANRRSRSSDRVSFHSDASLIGLIVEDLGFVRISHYSKNWLCFALKIRGILRFLLRSVRYLILHLLFEDFEREEISVTSGARRRIKELSFCEK